MLPCCCWLFAHGCCPVAAGCLHTDAALLLLAVLDDSCVPLVLLVVLVDSCVLAAARMPRRMALQQSRRVKRRNIRFDNRSKPIPPRIPSRQQHHQKQQQKHHQHLLQRTARCSHHSWIGDCNERLCNTRLCNTRLCNMSSAALV